MSHLEDAKIVQQAIYKIIFYDWDPIGVQHFPGAEDEYDSYIPTIYKLLLSHQSKSDIFDYLWWVETEQMELRGNRKKTEEIAGELWRLVNEE